MAGILHQNRPKGPIIPTFSRGPRPYRPALTLVSWDKYVRSGPPFTLNRKNMPCLSLFVLTFALSMIACGDGDRQPENQSSNPLYPSGPEQVQRGQIVT